MNQLYQIYNTIIRIMLIYVLVAFAWAGLEILLYGELKPDSIDSIVTLILAISLESHLSRPRVIGEARYGSIDFDVFGLKEGRVQIKLGKEMIWIPVNELEEYKLYKK